MQRVFLVALIACSGKPAAEVPPSTNVVAEAAPADARVVERAPDPWAPREKGEERAEEVPAVLKMIEWRDAMCACTNKACADKVQAEMTIWSNEMAQLAARNAPESGSARADGEHVEPRPLRQPSAPVMKRMVEISEAYGACMTKALGVP